MFCQQCGTRQPAQEGRFCINCGARLARPILRSQPGPKPAAHEASAYPAPSAGPPADGAAAPSIEVAEVMPPSPSDGARAEPAEARAAPVSTPPIDGIVPPVVEVAETQPVDAQPVPMAEPAVDQLPPPPPDKGATAKTEAAHAAPVEQADTDVALTHSLSLVLPDGRVQHFLTKGTPLPARRREIHRTAVPFTRGQSGSLLRIPIVEGENVHRDDRNRLIGYLDIPSDRVRRDVPAGSEVEITIEIDSSRLVHVTAYVPVLDEEFPARLELEKVAPRPADLAADFRQERERLDKVREKQQQAGDGAAAPVLQRIDAEEMVPEIETALRAAEADRDAANKCQRRLQDLKVALDEAEDALEWPNLVAEAEERLKDAREMVAEHGTSEERARLAALKREMRAAIASRDGDSLRHKVTEIGRLYGEVHVRQDALDQPSLARGGVAEAASPALSTPPTERAVRSSQGLEIGGRFGDHSQWAASPLRAVSVNIYQLNVFRVLDLPGSATPQQISRQAQRLSMLQRLGTGIPNNSLLPFADPPDHEAIREATHRIRDPETRIVDELFWLWPLSPETSDGDEALERLRQQDHEGAVRLWRQADEAGHHDSVPCHNLAVFHHLLAIESALGVSGQIRLSKGRRSQTLTYWRESLTCWHRLCTNDAFWEELAERIRKVDDPRLTTGTARRIRADLPRALLWINATLSAHAAQSGDRQRARDHVTLIRETNFDVGVANEVLRQASSPYRERIKAACAAAEKETDEEPESGEAVALRLLDEAKSQLAVIDQLLPSGDPVRETSHDEVAVTVMRCQIGFANKTDKWKESIALLEQALAIAESASMRQKIEENLEICRGNLEYGNCWFCKEEPAEDSAALQVNMHKVTARIPTIGGTRVQFRSVTVRVPRCGACRSAHTVPNISAGLGGMVGGLLGIGPCAAVVSANADATGVGWALFGALAICGAIAGYAIGRLRYPLVKGESAKNAFPAVRKLIDEGFSFGAKPSG
jgi:hypothetical protein